METRALTTEANKAIRLYNTFLNTFKPEDEGDKRQLLRMAIMAVVNDAYRKGLEAGTTFPAGATIILPKAAPDEVPGQD